MTFLVNKVLVIFGTRPEAIKLAPVILALQNCSGLAVRTCATAQHRELLDQVLNVFHIAPDYDLNLMRPDQSLAQITASGRDFAARGSCSMCRTASTPVGSRR